ncbi:MAG: hypothetical protein WBA22_06710 [Candidatus Methanofastidiosia archaeon]
MKSTFWPHSVHPYSLFRAITNEPRISVSQLARNWNVNRKTAEIWYRNAIRKRIIIPPILRKKSFANFREYIHFFRVSDPHLTFEQLKNEKGIKYFSIQAGFANLEVISDSPLGKGLGDLVIGGYRSDYYVSIPPNCTFMKSVSMIEKKLSDIDDTKNDSSPLISRDIPYEPWNRLDEGIFGELDDELRKPFAHVLRITGAYSDKVMDFFRRKDEFSHTITMFFPDGEKSYLLSVYLIRTKNDSLLIDLFSIFPASTVFYRLKEYLIMNIYTPFVMDYPAGYIIKKTLSHLKKKELVEDFTNSIVEYYFRP